MYNTAMYCLLEQIRDNPGAIDDSNKSVAARWALEFIDSIRQNPAIINNVQLLINFLQDAPKLDFKEDKTLSWIAYMHDECTKQLDAIKLLINGQ